MSSDPTKKGSNISSQGICKRILRLSGEKSFLTRRRKYQVGGFNTKNSSRRKNDRGSQYTSKGFEKLALKKGIKLSMSGKGNCYDNEVMEIFFHTLKTEHVCTNFLREKRLKEACLNGQRFFITEKEATLFQGIFLLKNMKEIGTNKLHEF